jgi:hypothetical protein
MSITYRIDEDVGVIFETWKGDVSAHELGEYWKGYLADPEVMKLRRTLVDLRSAKLMFSGSDMSVLIQTVVNPVLEGRDWKTAIVVNSPIQFGVSRQYGVFADHYSTDAIFGDVETGLAWLLAQQ